jgi:beta-barrel assembly-enhancing protease
MWASGTPSTKLLLPVLLATATLTLRAQSPAANPPAQTTAAQTGSSQPATSQTPDPAKAPEEPNAPDTTKSSDQTGTASADQAGTATAPAATSDTQASDKPVAHSDKKDKKEKKDKKKQDAADAKPTAAEAAAIQDTAIHAQKNTAPEPGPNGVMPGVKAGSSEDVNAVGTRDIGGRGLGNWYSTETEMKEGKAVSMEIEKSVKFINDPVVTEYVNRIGQNIVKNSDAKVPFTIKVIDTDEINAMALPGGFFYVNSGLILAADNEAEMAGVMAHEIAHVAAHHAMREQTRLNYAQFGTIPLIFIGGGLGYGLYEAAGLAVPITFLQFSRDFERQADFLGVQYLYRAGYDPQAFAAFFEKIQNLEKTKPGMVAKAFSDHPQTPDRIQSTQNEIAHLLPPKDEYVITTSEFDEVKARLARIQNKRKLRDGQDQKKPSLRRASNGQDPQDGQTQTQTKTDDDRPTLHRRDD